MPNICSDAGVNLNQILNDNCKELWSKTKVQQSLHDNFKYSVVLARFCITEFFNILSCCGVVA